MNDIINSVLDQIESDYHVKILFACEAGSRMWGTASSTSDYDVRFIYIHQPAWYLSIDKKRDVIEKVINKELDINGWEITKALRLFRKSNPSFLEWIHSPIKYRKSLFVNQILELEQQMISPKTLMHHYLNMAKQNCKTLLNGNPITKDYLNVIRPILFCKWLVKWGSMPPIHLSMLTDAMIKDNKRINKVIHMLIERKRLNIEAIENKDAQEIYKFCRVEIESVENNLKTMPKDMNHLVTAQLNELFQETLISAWN